MTLHQNKMYNVGFAIQSISRWCSSPVNLLLILITPFTRTPRRAASACYCYVTTRMMFWNLLSDNSYIFECLLLRLLIQLFCFSTFWIWPSFSLHTVSINLFNPRIMSHSIMVSSTVFLSQITYVYQNSLF